MNGRITEDADMDHRVSRRRLVQTGAASAAALGLFHGKARTGWSKNVFVQGEPITLTYWHGWTEQWAEMVQFVVDQFHTKQSRIRIEPEIVAWEEFETKLTAAVAAGDPPDIATLFGSTAIPTFANEEAILALNDIEGYDDAAVQAWMDPSVYRLGQFGDKVYGLSYWAGAFAIMWNKANFTEAGLDPEVGPATVADLDALADQLTVRDADGNISRLGFSSNDLWLWGTVFGGSFFDDANQKVTANDPAIIQALTWMRTYPEKYDPQKVAEFQEGLSSERAQNLDPFISGQYAMQVQGPWKLGDIRKFGDPNFQYGVVPMPKATPESPSANWTWGDIQIIPEGTSDASAAAEFVLHTAGVNDPEGYAERCTWGGRPINVPVSRSVLEVPSFQQVVADYPGFSTFIDALLTSERVGSPPVMPAAAFYNNRMTSTVEEVLLLQSEPQSALDSLTEEVQRELDRAAR